MPFEKPEDHESYYPIPVVRLEIESMKRNIVKSFSGVFLQMDADLKAAVEAVCSPQHVQLVLKKEVERVLDEEIRSAVERFYKFGEGRNIVAAAVKEKLLGSDSPLGG